MIYDEFPDMHISIDVALHCVNPKIEVIEAFGLNSLFGTNH